MSTEAKGREARLLNLGKRHVRSAIAPGSLVEHQRHGVGRVLWQWGGWKEVLPDKGTMIEINGSQIYDIRFASGILSVNRVWLKLVNPSHQ